MKGTNLSYEIEDDVIIIQPLRTNQAAAKDSKKVKGIVKDVYGNTLAGATILIKGTNMGVIADAEGKFVLEIPAIERYRLYYAGSYCR